MLLDMPFKFKIQHVSACLKDMDAMEVILLFHYIIQSGQRHCSAEYVPINAMASEALSNKDSAVTLSLSNQNKEFLARIEVF